MRVVRKRPSPDPTVRLEKRWSNRHETGLRVSATKVCPIPPPPPTEPKKLGPPCPTATPQEGWWNKSDLNWRDAQQSRRKIDLGVKPHGEALPAIAHLSQLGKVNPSSKYPDTAMSQGTDTGVSSQENYLIKEFIFIILKVKYLTHLIEWIIQWLIDWFVFLFDSKYLSSFAKNLQDSKTFNWNQRKDPQSNRDTIHLMNNRTTYWRIILHF